jgi:carbon-monoxide dehydrogenase small subunit
MRSIAIMVNGDKVHAEVDDRLSLADLLRDVLELTGTVLGCEEGYCGSCTVQVGGKLRRSCITLAAQVDGEQIRTIEGVEGSDGELSDLQRSFWEHHAAQCGFCTAGMVLTAEALLAETDNPDEATIRSYIQGNLCRCTGYQNIVQAIRCAATAPTADGGRRVVR